MSIPHHEFTRIDPGHENTKVNIQLHAISLWAVFAPKGKDPDPKKTTLVLNCGMVVVVDKPTKAISQMMDSAR